MFPGVLELEPGVRYLLSLTMGEDRQDGGITDQLGTVWGYQGVPRRRRTEHQNHFRWFQVYRHDQRSSVTSGQFPIIYYIA